MQTETTQVKTELEADVKVPSQVQKFKGRIIKKAATTTRAEVLKKYNFIDLTAAIEKHTSTNKKVSKSKGRFKTSETKEKDWIAPTIFGSTEIKTPYNSIRNFINECHPDIKKLIEKAEISTVTAGAGELRIVTKNGIRIVISSIGQFQRHIKITHKKTILFDGKTSVTIEKGEKKAA